MTPLARLSGGQKGAFSDYCYAGERPATASSGRANESFGICRASKELETALVKYSGAILYVSHDNYFAKNLAAKFVQIGAE